MLCTASPACHMRKVRVVAAMRKKGGQVRLYLQAHADTHTQCEFAGSQELKKIKKHRNWKQEDIFSHQK